MPPSPPPRPRSQCIPTTTTGEAGLCRKLLKQAACPSKQTWWFVEGDAHGGARSAEVTPDVPSLRCTSHPWPNRSGTTAGVPQDQRPLILLVDLKTSCRVAPQAGLKAVLEAYADILKAPAGHHQAMVAFCWRFPVQAPTNRKVPMRHRRADQWTRRSAHLPRKALISESFRSRFRWSDSARLTLTSKRDITLFPNRSRGRSPASVWATARYAGSVGKR